MFSSLYFTLLDTPLWLYLPYKILIIMLKEKADKLINNYYLILLWSTHQER